MVRIHEIDQQDISKILKANFNIQGKISIDEQNIVSVDGGVILRRKMDRLPCQFDAVTGLFYAVGLGLKSLIGSPKKVRDFNVSRNEFESLEGAPQIIMGEFVCNGGHLQSLKGGPQSVTGRYVVSNNQLIDLEGAPAQVFDDFVCHNNQLTSLKGAPKMITGPLLARNNPFKSLEGLPEKAIIGLVTASPDLPVLRAVMIPYRLIIAPTDSTLSTGFNHNNVLSEMIEKYRKNTSMNNRQKILALQKELIENGYESNAKW